MVREVARARGRARGRHDRAHGRRVSAALVVRGPGAVLRRRRRRCHLGEPPLRRHEPGGEGGALLALARRPAREDDRARSRHACGRHRVGERRRRQVDAHRESRGCAGRARRARRSARRRRLRPLDPAHARRAAAPRRRRHHDRPSRARDAEADVDRLLPRRQQPGDVARADAAPGARAVPLRRPLGRAGHARRRHAARHRGRLDLSRPAASARGGRDRDDAAAGRAAGRGPRSADGPEGGDADRRRRREHVVARRHRPGAVRRRGRAASRRGDRGTAARPGAVRSRAARSGRRRDTRVRSSARLGGGPGDRRAGRADPAHAPRHPQGPHGHPSS